MHASQLDDVNHFMRRDVKFRTGQVDDLIVVVDAVPDAGGDVRRQVSDADASPADGVDSLSSVVDRVSERQAERATEAEGSNELSVAREIQGGAFAPCAHH